MQRTLLFAKIHNATVTAANINYMGSISIDRALLDAAGIFPNEQVQVVNVTNGARFVTYAIPAPPQSGAIELNGAAARLVTPGDRVIIISYAQLTLEEIQNHAPTLVFVNERNRIIAHSKATEEASRELQSVIAIPSSPEEIY